MFRSIESSASPEPRSTESGTDATDPVPRRVGYVGSKAGSSSSSLSALEVSALSITSELQLFITLRCLNVHLNVLLNSIAMGVTPDEVNLKLNLL